MPLPVSADRPGVAGGGGGHAAEVGCRLPGVGLGTRFHAVPFHRRIRLVPGPHPRLMLADRPGVAGGSRGHAEEDVGEASAPGSGWAPASTRCRSTARSGSCRCRLSADRPGAAGGGRRPRRRERRRPGSGWAPASRSVPFHRRIRVLPLLPVRCSRPPRRCWRRWRPRRSRRLSRRAGAGHPLPGGAVPAHDQGLGRCRVAQPTAQALLAEVAATPERPIWPALGLGTCFQAVPFHRRISVLAG